MEEHVLAGIKSFDKEQFKKTGKGKQCLYYRHYAQEIQFNNYNININECKNINKLVAFSAIFKFVPFF